MIKAQELLNRFVTEIQDQYPDLTPEDIKRAASAPFFYVREELKKPTLPDVRLKNMGLFFVPERIAKMRLYQYKKRLAEKNFTRILTETELIKYIENLTNYLAHVKDRDYFY